MSHVSGRKVPLSSCNRLRLAESSCEAFYEFAVEMVARLTKLIAIFESKAEGYGILGDAYEYLMRHSVSESGKSKGQ